MSSRKSVSLLSCFLSWHPWLFTGLLQWRNLKVRELTYKPGAGMQKAEGSSMSATRTVPSFKVEKRAYRGVIRNPFQALYPPPPPPLAPKSVPVPPPLPAPSAVITTMGPSPAQTESGRFRFLGFLQKEGESKIFLSRDKEKVKKGDSVTIFQWLI